MRNAQRRDPDDWHYAYGLAVSQALAGQDPRPAAAGGAAAQPARADDTISLARRIAPSAARRRWRAEAARSQIPFG